MWKSLKPAFFLKASRGATPLVARRIQDIRDVLASAKSIRKYKSRTSQFIVCCYTVLSSGTDQNASERNSEDLQPTLPTCDVVTEKCKQAICRDEL